MISFLALVGALVLLGPVGTAFVRWTLSQCGQKPNANSNDDTARLMRSGWLIGYLERALVAVGVVFGSWEVIAAVVALKSVSRYQELEKQMMAEYFLVGSLASLAWAVAIAFMFLGADSALGDSWIPYLSRLIARQ